MRLHFLTTLQMNSISGKYLLTFAKLAFIGAVLFYVFQGIQWRDRLQLLGAEGNVIEQQMGTIIGPWDGETVQFLDTTGQRSVVQVATSSGKRVSPGLMTYLRNINLALFLIGCLFYGFSIAFSGTRWWWLLRANGLSVNWSRAIRYTWIGLFCNNFIPGQTGGDVVKAVYVMRYCHQEKLRAVFSVIVDRLLGLGSLVLLSALITIFQVQRFPLIAASVWGILVLGLFFVVLLFSRRMRRIFRFHRLLSRLPSSVSGIVLQVNEAALLYRNYYKQLIYWWLAGMSSHTSVVIGTLFIGWSLQVGMPTAEYFVLVPVINMVSSIPIAPNGWGVGEAMFGKLFSVYGAGYLQHVVNPELVMRTRAVSLSILFRSQATLWSLLGGLFMLLERGKKNDAD